MVEPTRVDKRSKFTRMEDEKEQEKQTILNRLRISETIPVDTNDESNRIHVLEQQVKALLTVVKILIHREIELEKNVMCRILSESGF